MIRLYLAHLIQFYFQIQEGYETLRREAPQLMEGMRVPGMGVPPTATTGGSPSASNDMMRQMLQQMR